MNSRHVIVPVGFEPPDQFRDQLAKLAQHLMTLTSMTKERRDYGHYIDLDDDIWRHWFGGSRASKIKKAAIDCGLMEANQSYEVGDHPKSFRLAKQYRTGEYKAFNFNRSQKQCELYPPKKTVKNKGGKHNKNTEDRMGEVGVMLKERLRDFAIPDSVRAEKHWDKFAIDRIKNGLVYATRCRFGRFHSSFNSLPKEIRRELKTRSGQKMVSVDIANSQPLLLGLSEKSRLKIQTTPTPHQPTPLCHTLRKFLSICESGQIYEFVVDRLHENEVDPCWIKSKKCRKFKVDPREWDREKVKEAFIVCMFDRIEGTIGNPVFLILENHFPEIAKYIIDAKRDFYQGLAHDCQRVESSLMIDGVAMEFMQTHPKAAILTIHDEIMVEETFLDSLIKIIKKHFGRFGVSPKLSINTQFPDKSGNFNLTAGKDL